MFYIWWDDLMEVSGFIHTSCKRRYFVDKYGWNSFKNWMGTNR